MMFNSVSFLIFFPVVVIIYFAVPRRLKQFWLLICSYYFYMSWNAGYAGLILFTTVTTYGCGILLEKVKQSGQPGVAKRKKTAVALALLFNLSLLFYFKYFNFFISVLEKVMSYTPVHLHIPEFDILLPVGISFYTFQALSYIIDIYRDQIPAEKNFFRYALFVSFFPQLVAGPIERSASLLKQLAEPKKFCFERARDGLLLMLWGFFLKIVLSDRIALFVDTVYGDVLEYGGWYLIIATALFAVQIYCDFYGYSVIAMGAAEILGIRLMENFSSPYLAVSVADFWRRWHISLTSWFKDYLYIPLGGSRRGKMRKYTNKLIVFLTSGLWHGASISFVVWGGLNGIYQIIGEILQPARDRIVSALHLNRKSIGHKLLQMSVTFLLIDFSWIFFRSSGCREALEVIRQILHAQNTWILFDGSLYHCGLDRSNFFLMLLCMEILIASDFCKYKGIKIREVIARQDIWFRWVFIVFATCAILTLGIWGPGYNTTNFIYFQF